MFQRISVIGRGRVGAAIAARLAERGLVVADERADLVLFAVPDSAIRGLAACRNVWVKLGGLGMRILGFDFHERPAPPASAELAAAWRPYVETCIELFGANRCVAESNFPVEKMGIGYAGLFNALKRLTSGASADEKAAIFAGTARRVYRLDC